MERNSVIQLEIASGTVLGKDHRREGRNNHDGCFFWVDDNALVAVVTDGCGSSKHSEIGAKLGARLIVKAAASTIDRYGTDNTYLERVRQDVLAQLRVIALQMGNSLSEVVNDYLLFTVVGVVMSRRMATFFSIGDGHIIVNNSAIELGPFSNNMPPYMSYGLVPTSLQETAPEQLQFKTNLVMPSIELDSFLIGTDGIGHLICSEEKLIPGKDEPVGPISQFWEDDRYFINPDNIRRRLTLINREVVQPDWDARMLCRQSGHLPDDTTMIVGRRRREIEE